MRVVAAVDGSEHTHKVVGAAERFAGDGHIYFVHVSGTYIYPHMIPPGTMVDFEQIRKDQVEAVWRKVGRMPENAEAVTLEGGPAAQMITDFAKNVDADLIVIGSRGRGAFSSLVLGSVSQGVAHESDRDVLIVK